MDRPNNPLDREASQWHRIALDACENPEVLQPCPKCQNATAISASWHLNCLGSRDAEVSLACTHCDLQEKVSISLPDDAIPFWPLDRIDMMAEVFERESEAIAAKVQQHIKAMPAAQFTTHPMWAEANWSATTYRWHPTSDAPPVMGLVFENSEAGLQIFKDAERLLNHEDRFEEIRISIIQGNHSEHDQRPGYSIHLCADPEALCGHATMADFVLDSSVVPFLGQWNRHYPVPGAPTMLPRFKEEFDRHQEFLLAPTVLRSDGQRYIVPELGIVKNILLFRNLSEITDPEDTDVAAHVLPDLIVPPQTS